MSDQPKRRELELNSFDEVVAEIRGLAKTGYRLVGNWNLAQICEHCSLWMQYPMDGFPIAPLPFRVIFWVVRKTLGKRKLAKTLKNGFKAGLPTIPESVPHADQQSDQEAVTEFMETIDRFRNHEGPIHESPLYGKMDRETLTKLQQIHASHHLSFLIPNTEP